MLKSPLITSLIVGSILTAFNQYDYLTGGAEFVLWQAGLSYLVPFLVSLVSRTLTLKQLNASIAATQENKEANGGANCPACHTSEPVSPAHRAAEERAVDVDVDVSELDAAQSVIVKMGENAKNVNTASRERAVFISELVITAQQLQQDLKVIGHTAKTDADNLNDITARIDRANEGMTAALGQSKDLIGATCEKLQASEQQSSDNTAEMASVQETFSLISQQNENTALQMQQKIMALSAVSDKLYKIQNNTENAIKGSARNMELAKSADASMQKFMAGLQRTTMTG